MRLLFVCVQSFDGFFDQMSTCVVLVDMFYENKRYDQVLDLMDWIREKQIGGVKYPMDCFTLAIATCYKLVRQRLKFAFCVRGLGLNHYWRDLR
jgi:hypothetical protein